MTLYLICWNAEQSKLMRPIQPDNALCTMRHPRTDMRWAGLCTGLLCAYVSSFLSICDVAMIGPNKSPPSFFVHCFRELQSSLLNVFWHVTTRALLIDMKGKMLSDFSEALRHFQISQKFGNFAPVTCLGFSKFATIVSYCFLVISWIAVSWCRS